MDTAETQLRTRVRERYAAAAQAVLDRRTPTGEAAAQAPACCHPEGSEPGPPDAGGTGGPDGYPFGAGRYHDGERNELPADVLAASLGCGNPTAVADLVPGETVLDLGSGGGIDVLLAASRVGPTGFVYGLDMTEQMLALARANAAQASVGNVEFRRGLVEDIPLPDASVDVVISNCVINLSTDKPAALAEMFRVLVPGGRIGITDVVAEDHLTPAERAERGSYTGCIAGAVSQQEYLDGLAAAGFAEAAVRFTHEAVPGLHAAVVRAIKPGTR
ncbi:MAG: methyltransferase domain-containing protein [Geodermatophilaceae bacterium]